ncbi:hypothetical protein MO973_01970 [Paenibacillus sp. TRM 82003]|nr:hypothetical protein [Paenibacillus sp. TRM 82003]
MASRKTYLYGLGTGLIVGAVMLQLATIGESTARTPIPEAEYNLTEQELTAAAKRFGYVLKQADVVWYSEEEVAAKIAEAERRVRAETPPPGEAPNGSAAQKVYAFTIAPGTELRTVADLLYELGLVSDYNEFLQEMDERQLTGKVQAKHYRFDEIPTLDALIEKLTTP